MGLDRYILQRFLVLDPSKLEPARRDQLIRVFEQHAKTKLPSIIEQLKTRNPVRRAIDLAILEALEIKGNHEELLDSALASISMAIGTLATLMKEGQVDE